MSKRLHGGIVLTGGGSQLKHITQLVEYVTGISARIGFPVEHLTAGNIKEVESPAYATCVGLVLNGMNQETSNLYNVPIEEKVIRTTVWSWFREIAIDPIEQFIKGGQDFPEKGL